LTSDASKETIKILFRYRYIDLYRIGFPNIDVPYFITLCCCCCSSDVV